MHEYPITQAIVETAERHARRHRAARVTAINLVIGDHSGYLADAIELYFDIVAKGSLAETARLNIERVRPMLRCAVCGGLFRRRPFEFSCPEPGCGGEGAPTDIGREFLVKSIEIETD